MAQAKTRDWFASVTAWVIIISAAPFFFDVVRTLGRQVIFWLKHGVWQSDTLWNGLHFWFFTERPSSTWTVPNNVLNWFLDGSRALWMLVLGFAVVFLETAIFALIASAWENIQAGRKEGKFKFKLSRRAKRNLILWAVYLLVICPITAAILKPSKFGDTWVLVGMMGAMLALYYNEGVSRFKERQARRLAAQEQAATPPAP
jgi:hypothetical protein